MEEGRAGGANLRAVKEQSQIDDMRAAVRGDRERAEQARQRSTENVRALLPEPAPTPNSSPTRNPCPCPSRSAACCGACSDCRATLAACSGASAS